MPATHADPIDRFSWRQINDGYGATWEPRAGLQAVKHRGKFFVRGGRSLKIAPKTFVDSNLYDDVWRCTDPGLSWKKLSGEARAPWQARAYFQALTKAGISMF